MPNTMIMDGRCHCGAVTVTFEARSAPADIAVRACQCSFCRKHGARTVADPEGRLTLVFDDDNAVSRYRFSEKTADFLLCATCGVYVCALVESEGGWRATLNINVLDDRSEFPAHDEPVDYDGETAGARIARRIAGWTPTRIVRTRT